MTQRRTVHAIDSHTCGHPTRLVTAGVPDPPGSTVREKQEYFARHHDRLRTSIVYEPRGHAGMFAAVLVAPTDPTADIGLLFLSVHKYVTMCGHGTIGAVTSLLETGRLPVTSPVTTLRVETPSGVVPVEATVRDGRVTAVSFVNVPCHVRRPQVTVDVDGVGEVPVDVGYGGEWYALVDVELLGTSLSPAAFPDVLRRASGVKTILNGRRQDGEPQISGVLVYDLSGPPGTSRGVVVFSGTRYDRSPCGTGTSALTALLVERGVLRRGDTLRNTSIIGTTFDAEVVETVEREDGRTSVPRIRGSAHVTGFNELVIAADDPLADGFLLDAE